MLTTVSNFEASRSPKVRMSCKVEDEVKDIQKWNGHRNTKQGLREFNCNHYERNHLLLKVKEWFQDFLQLNSERRQI